jgi:hypothetical protein
MFILVKTVIRQGMFLVFRQDDVSTTENASVEFDHSRNYFVETFAS